MNPNNKAYAARMINRANQIRNSKAAKEVASKAAKAGGNKVLKYTGKVAKCLPVIGIGFKVVEAGFFAKDVYNCVSSAQNSSSVIKEAAKSCLGGSVGKTIASNTASFFLPGFIGMFLPK